MSGDDLMNFALVFSSRGGSVLGEGNAAQVTRHGPQTWPQLHPVLPVIGAFVPAEVPPQARNAPLDARTPPIAALPTACALDHLAFLRELARSRDGHSLDSCSRENLRSGAIPLMATRPSTT